MFLTPTVTGFNEAGFGWGDHNYIQLRDLANQSEELYKSFTTGEGIVSAGQGSAGDGSKLRVQFLHNVLEEVSFEQEDAGLMKVIPKQKVYSNTFEWSQLNQYGGAGDGFTTESGFDTNQFGINASDDIFTRLVLQIKYLCAVRNISLPAQLVRNIENAEKVAEHAATLELIGKTNSALYWGDSTFQKAQFNGFIRQMLDWLTNNNQDSGILWDAGGLPIDKIMLEDIQIFNKTKYGRGSLLMTSVQAYGDSQKLLFPAARYEEGTADANYGIDKKKFRGVGGVITLKDDVLLRPNRPLMLEGYGVTGAPRLTTTQADFIPTYSAAPATAAAASASTGSFWINTTNYRDGVPAAAPALPSGDGNNASRLVAGQTYTYAIAPVYKGLEGQAIVVGNSTAAGTVGTPTGVAPTATQVVTITITHSNLSGGLPSGASVSDYANWKWRVYRFTGTVATGTVSGLQFLCETGVKSDGSCVVYDNGFNVPGSDNAFLITERKNGAVGWFLAQLLPLMRRQGLPSFIMGDPLALLLFCAPILLVPRHHVWIRNIGRAS